MSAYKKALKRNRVLLLRELPDVETLLSTDHLKPCFTRYERSQMLSCPVPSDKAVALLDLLDTKEYHVYESFLAALRPFKPALASVVETTEREIRDSSAASSPCSNSSSAPPLSSLDSLPNGEHSRQLSANARHPRLSEDGGGEEEDAGLYGLKGHGPGSIHRLAHLSYAGREFLAERLNGTPQDRNTFNNFCLALGVDQRLVQVSMRSRNPTGYLIQEFSEKPEATFDRLERALSEIGHHELFHQLQAVDSRPMYGGDDV